MIQTTDMQYLYKLSVIFLYSFFITYWTVPMVIQKLRKYKYVVPDVYKKGKTLVPSMGGIAILAGVLVSLSLLQILLNTEDIGPVFILYFVIIVYTLYGVVDDLFAFRKRYDKIIVLLVLTFPVASLVKDNVINIFSYSVDIGWFYPLLIIPVYIMVVANLLNLHAGYNGLTQGLGLLLLITIGIKSYMLYGLENLIFLIPILGATLAFFPYTFVPAKILPKNAGDFLVGSAIGCLLVVNNLLWFGIFILIPHIINFLMDTWTIVIRKIPDAKYGHVRKDGTIFAPPTMKYKSLKFLIVTWWRLTEKQAVLILYGFTAVFCALALVLF